MMHTHKVEHSHLRGDEPHAHTFDGAGRVLDDGVRNAYGQALNPGDAYEDLVEVNKRLRAHLQDRSDEAKVRNVDAYETRKDLEALVEALVEKCQQATDENADARWMLMELRNVLAARLPFDEDYAERLFAQRRGLRATIEAYLRSVGFVSAIYPDGREGWGHPELGYGRYFEDAVTWWIGREKAEALLVGTAPAVAVKPT